MKRAWAVLGGLVLAGAIALTLAARMPRRAPPPEAAPAPPPVDVAAFELADGSIRPERTDAVLGHRLAVTITNRGRTRAHLGLSGYEHAFGSRVLAPGESLTDTLLLDLPGEDFAWMLDGRPAAQLRVAGSHLVEGHR